MGHVFNPVNEEHKKEIFSRAYCAHLPGYTGHCPTLKFRVGKRFGACTEEIMRELLEKKILKTGPYTPTADNEVLLPVSHEKSRKSDWARNEQPFYKSPPYILGYTGYIPGFNSRYGVPFMRAVEEGAKEWYETQRKLKAQRESVRAYAKESVGMLSKSRNVNHNFQADYRQEGKRAPFDYQVSPKNPPIVGYTGHIPGAKAEAALSRRYALAARKGLELVQKEREERLRVASQSQVVRNALDATCSHQNITHRMRS